MAQRKKPATIQVKMLGQFSICCEEAAFTDMIGRTKQVWILLEYLILNRKREISQDELMHILWGTGNSDNPANALKNLVYRLRTMLSESGLPPYSYIVYHKGVYSWNTEIDCEVDVEILEDCWKKASSCETSDEEKIKACQYAVELYEGRFLTKSSCEQWVISLGNYYHQLYLNCVKTVCPLLREREKHEQIVRICQKAISIDPYEETFFEFLITALIQLGNHKEALRQYGCITDRLYRDLGVNPSERIRSLYRKILSTTKDVQRDILVIKEDLQETDKAVGPYFCEYEIFKNIYRLSARGAQRTGQSVYILLITLTDEENELLPLKTMRRAMDLLQTAIGDSLRKEDVCARFSNSQYVLMLTSISYENCELVLKRIETRFQFLLRNKKVIMHKTMQPMDPIV